MKRNKKTNPHVCLFVPSTVSSSSFKEEKDEDEMVEGGAENSNVTGTG